ncbi:MAG: hypothetical protein HN405_00980 [Planctomycetes bacterium]|nr:hypothetical protein [Planctomycetota bacterium]MBT4027816.1 hypothetical protein [Planctomycetota bacterium]MBT5101132.1 hypothetical protein [Planctomycetota bacterium]MBT7318740.1 hypothetical protein [Planctomycetota bacterium]
MNLNKVLIGERVTHDEFEIFGGCVHVGFFLSRALEGDFFFFGCVGKSGQRWQQDEGPNQQHCHPQDGLDSSATGGAALICHDD